MFHNGIMPNRPHVFEDRVRVVTPHWCRVPKGTRDIFIPDVCVEQTAEVIPSVPL